MAALLVKQVQSKWNNSFARLNRGEPGISGLLAFSEVRHFCSCSPAGTHGLMVAD